MSGLGPWQDAVLDRLRTIPQMQVFVSGVPGVEHLQHNADNMFRPYLVVWWGGKTSAGFGYRGVCGTKGDASRALVTVQCVAPTGQVSADVANGVRDVLEGFQPAGMGELVEDGGVQPRSPVDASGVPVRYQALLAFSGVVENTLIG